MIWGITMKNIIIKLLSNFPVTWLRIALLRKTEVVTVSVILTSEFEDMVALNIGGAYKEKFIDYDLH